MKVSQLVRAVGTISPQSPEEAIVLLVQLLGSSLSYDRATVDALVQAVLRREELGVTAIGRGVALPHGRHQVVNGSVLVALGIIPEGLDWSAPDGKKVQLAFLCVSNPENPGQYLRTLEALTRLNVDRLLKPALTAPSGEEVIDAIRKAETPYGGADA